MQFHPTIPSADVPEGGSVAVEVEGTPIVLCRIDGVVHALTNRCSHAGSKLSGGRVRNGAIACPLHGARFNLETGHCLSKSQNFAPIPVHPARETNGMIEVSLSAQPV